MSDFSLSSSMKQNILSRDKFACQKCGFQNNECDELEVHNIKAKLENGEENPENFITLCSICHHYAPENETEFKKYLGEKIDGKILETFRKSKRSISQQTKKGMMKTFNSGGVLTKAPLGYKVINKKLVLELENVKKVKNIFKEFLETTISLTQLAKKNGLSTSGIIKVLKNTAYLGKVKWADQESQGTHQSIIEEELFNKVQEKLNN